MATILFTVKATIPPDKEAAFNRWYNEEHVPQVLQYPGLVSAHRYGVRCALPDERAHAARLRPGLALT